VRSTVAVLLALAAVAGALIGEYIEAAAIAVVLVVNTVVGFATELRAVRSVEGLRSLASAIADVERDDARGEVDAGELVPGDMVNVEAGDQVPADLRLVEASDLTVVESALTGESAPVEKTVDAAWWSPPAWTPKWVGSPPLSTRLEEAGHRCRRAWTGWAGPSPSWSSD
jgi:Ca2+-transporting ATPase